MARLGEVLIDPRDPTARADLITRFVQLLDQRIEMGDPSDPIDPNSGNLATGAATTHNGRLANFRGSWVEQDITVRFNTLFTHNLNVPVYNNGSFDEPNVRWFLTNFRHDGTGVLFNTSGILVEWVDGSAVTPNSIRLSVKAEAFRTISADHPLKICLFFVPAVRWP